MNYQLLRIKDEKVEVLFTFDIQAGNPIIYIDRKGIVWILGDGYKLYKSHYTQLSNNILKTNPALASDKLNLLVKFIYDHQGNLWLSNGGYGLFKETVETRKFEHILKGKSVWNVFEDVYDRLIYCFYRDYHIVNKGDENTPDSSPVSTTAHSLIEDGAGGFWKLDDDNRTDSNNKRISEPDAILLSHLDKNFNAFESFSVPIKNTGDNFSRLLRDRKGHLYLIGLRSTVILFDLRQKKFTVYPYTQLSPDFAGVHSCYFDSDDNLWICSQNGLFKGVPLSAGGFKFEVFRHDPQTPNSVADNQITMALDDPNEPKKYIWIATHGNGLDRLNKMDGTFLHFTTRNGLPNNSILGILSDENQQLWLSTYNGLVKFNPKTFTCANFVKQDGLQSEEFGAAACFKSKTGKLMFGGVSGLNIFKPSDLKNEKASAQVRISQLSINNQAILPFDKTGILTKSTEYTQKVSLAHNQNQVFIEFSVIDFKNTEKFRFRYRLAGIDQDWVEAGTDRFATYSQLQPGNYTFAVITSLDGESWSKPAELNITVNPPFYRTWLAYLLYLSIVSYLAYRWYQVQLNRVRLQQQLLYKGKEAEKLAELNTLKTNFFANISHEFRTPLTLLVGPLTDLQKKYPAEGMIPLMQRNLSRLQTLINQLLDLSKLEAGLMQPQIQYSDLPRFLRYVFASFESLAQTKNVIFQYSQSHTDQLAYFDEDKLEKIVSNLLSNAFKFTPENGRIVISVDYIASKEPAGGAWMTLTVTDTGIGIDAPRLPRIFDRFYQIDDSQRRHYEGTGIGLALVKELVDALRGSIRVESELGNGTSFIVQLPCDAENWKSVLTADMKPVLKERVIESVSETHKITPPSSSNQELPILLIVEDNPDLRSYIRNVFEDTYRIEEAQDGEEGLEKATELVPDVVICDLMMPRLDGFGFCKALKTDMRTNHIPVVMLTAKATLEDRLEGLELGADEYLSKPFNTEELQVRVRNLVQQRQALRQKYGQQTLLNIPAPVEALPKAAGIDEQFLHKAGSVLERCLSDSQFDVEGFAAEMGMTSVQLRRKIKALTDQTVTEYIRHYRLEKAAELLQQKAGTVSEIAYLVGFESLSYFSKVFQEKFGKTPSEWNV